MLAARPIPLTAPPPPPQQQTSSATATATTPYDVAVEELKIDTFPAKTYHMIEHCHQHNPAVARWTEDGTAFIVKDSKTLSKMYIPKYFKHSNFQSFVRQLNLYGFRSSKKTQVIQGGQQASSNNNENSGTANDGTTPMAHISFRHMYFLRNRRDLLRKIERSKSGDRSQRRNRMMLLNENANNHPNNNQQQQQQQHNAALGDNKSNNTMSNMTHEAAASAIARATATATVKNIVREVTTSFDGKLGRVEEDVVGVRDKVEELSEKLDRILLAVLSLGRMGVEDNAKKVDVDGPSTPTSSSKVLDKGGNGSGSNGNAYMFLGAEMKNLDKRGRKHTDGSHFAASVPLVLPLTNKPPNNNRNKEVPQGGDAYNAEDDAMYQGRDPADGSSTPTSTTTTPSSSPSPPAPSSSNAGNQVKQDLSNGATPAGSNDLLSLSCDEKLFVDIMLGGNGNGAGTVAAGGVVVPSGVNPNMHDIMNARHQLQQQQQQHQQANNNNNSNNKNSNDNPTENETDDEEIDPSILQQASPTSGVDDVWGQHGDALDIETTTSSDVGTLATTNSGNGVGVGGGSGGSGSLAIINDMEEVGTIGSHSFSSAGLSGSKLATNTTPYATLVHQGGGGGGRVVDEAVGATANTNTTPGINLQYNSPYGTNPFAFDGSNNTAEAAMRMNFNAIAMMQAQQQQQPNQQGSAVGGGGIVASGTNMMNMNNIPGFAPGVDGTGGDFDPSSTQRKRKRRTKRSAATVVLTGCLVAMVAAVAFTRSGVTLENNSSSPSSSDDGVISSGGTGFSDRGSSEGSSRSGSGGGGSSSYQPVNKREPNIGTPPTTDPDQENSVGFDLGDGSSADTPQGPPPAPSPSPIVKAPTSSSSSVTTANKLNVEVYCHIEEFSTLVLTCIP